MSIFFFMEFSNFTPGLALHGLLCRMMVKVRELNDLIIKLSGRNI